MESEPSCIACNVKRNFTGAARVAYGYEISAFECPQCKSVLKLVVRGNLGPLPKARRFKQTVLISHPENI